MEVAALDERVRVQLLTFRAAEAIRPVSLRNDSGVLKVIGALAIDPVLTSRRLELSTGSPLALVQLDDAGILG